MLRHCLTTLTTLTLRDTLYVISAEDGVPSRLNYTYLKHENNTTFRNTYKFTAFHMFRTFDITNYYKLFKNLNKDCIYFAYETLKHHIRVNFTHTQYIVKNSNNFSSRNMTNDACA